MTPFAAVAFVFVPCCSERDGGKHRLFEREVDDLTVRVCALGHITMAWSAVLVPFDEAGHHNACQFASMYAMMMR